MKVAVCIKRVPDMEMRFSIAEDRKSLDPGGLKYEMGDFDGYALEVGLQLVEKQESGEVVIVSVGPDAVQETLRKGLAMGATRAVQLKSDEVPFDGLAIAQALAAELKDGAYDLILFGRLATDTASGTVGPMTAELLGRTVALTRVPLNQSPAAVTFAALFRRRPIAAARCPGHRARRLRGSARHRRAGVDTRTRLAGDSRRRGGHHRSAL